MSKTTELAEKRKTSAPEEQPPIAGCELMVKCLELEGVDTIFAYPGGASMEFHQALTRSEKIRVVLPRHEQGGVFSACGYARASGKVGVCMATSGPGATNLVTGIADAYMDSIPLVAITGQVPQHLIGRNAFQEIDIYGISLSIVKHSYLVTDVKDIPRIVKEAFYIASSGRPGPVLIDVPKNIQQTKTTPVFLDRVNVRGYDVSTHIDDSDIKKIIDLIEKSERPVLYVGGGIISGEASQELRRFVEKTKIPVTSTLMGCGTFPETDPLSLRWLGMHGSAFANWAVSGELVKDGENVVVQAPGADLLLAFGVRFDDRVTGKVDKFCEHGTIVHIDIDASELNKNRRAHLPIQGDVRYALKRMNEMLEERPLQKKFAPWHKQIEAWKQKAPFTYQLTAEVLKSQHMKDHMGGQSDEVILPQMVVEMLWELTKGEAIIMTGVGQHQMWAAQFYPCKFPRQLLTSAGLGSMGFGYPAALGAKVAFPHKQVVDIDGDGSFMMNIQELATAHIEKIGAKVIILNNQHLGMVMQWEDRFYKGNRGNTYLGDPDNMKQIYPDYVGIANGFNVEAARVMFKKDLKAAMQRMLDCKDAFLLDVIVPYTEHVLPFVPAARSVADMIWRP